MKLVICTLIVPIGSSSAQAMILNKRVENIDDLFSTFTNSTFSFKPFSPNFTIKAPTKIVEHYLIDPLVIPLMICFCIAKKKIRSGMMLITRAASAKFHCFVY